MLAPLGKTLKGTIMVYIEKQKVGKKILSLPMKYKEEILSPFSISCT